MKVCILNLVKIEIILASFEMVIKIHLHTYVNVCIFSEKLITKYEYG